MLPQHNPPAEPHQAQNDFITVLKSIGPLLTKTFDGDAIVPYGQAKHFTVETVPVGDLSDLAMNLEWLAPKTRRGVIRGGFVGDARAQDIAPPERPGQYLRIGALFEEHAHHWWCADHDSFRSVLFDPVLEPEEAVQELVEAVYPPEFHKAGYFWQLSSSAGRTPGVLKVHLWWWCARKYTGPEIEAWVRANRLEIDIVTLRRVQLNYTANPVFKNGAIDPMGGRRGGLRAGPAVELDIPQEVIDAAGARVRSTSNEEVELTDPTQKPGLIGAFCKAYPISRVINELLPDQFSYAEGSDRRVTWHGGNGAVEGVFVTDDDWHLCNTHNTSPSEDRLLNAWDVVRIYQFGHLDADLTLDEQALAGIGSLPSQGAMKAWAEKLPDIQGATDAEFPTLADCPTFRVFDKAHGKMKPGVWYFFSERQGEIQVQRHTRLCSPLHIEAVTYDAQDNNFGRLLRFKNTMGRERKWAMPMEMLCADGVPLRAELLSMGMELDPYEAKKHLHAYLQAKVPERRMRCAQQVGWCGAAFVLPDTVIGPAAAEVIFQSGERGHLEHTQAGTASGWRDGVAALAGGNPLLALALSAAFAGPLLAKCNAESGGIHFVGDSSTGKTTAIEAACSIWGGPQYKRSWRATANGMEGAAAMFNDCLLALDEISECDPREVGAIVYALGNGRGKQRANRTGSARGVTSWRCVVLSSGERTIATAMAEGGHRAKAGQAVRLLDVPTMRKHGTWDVLHGKASAAAFSDDIKRAATTHYGHAGRAFLERLAHDARDFCAHLETLKALPQLNAADAEGQDKRAAGRFALFALAGELATEYGITGWPEGEATKAAAEGFTLWRSLRGRGNDERRQILERVSDFIERHGDARFSRMRTPEETKMFNGDPDQSSGLIVRDRAGWYRDIDGGREYLFTAEGLREALKGFDFTRGLDTLQTAGALPPSGADGKRAKSYRPDGRPVKLYAINADRLAFD
ncbi:MAG: DUF927 domain-containing protein [Candidatus Accumulibacter sp. UW25]|jgi:putative DNA primase/helicase